MARFDVRANGIVRVTIELSGDEAAALRAALEAAGIPIEKSPPPTEPSANGDQAPR
jgi:hypothetical protein